MKKLIGYWALGLTFCSVAFGQGTRGGVDFQYMRQLESLTSVEIKQILKNDGSQFMQSVIAPTSMAGLQFNLGNQTSVDPREEINSSGDAEVLRREKALKSIWVNFFQNNPLEFMRKVAATPLKDCSCADVIEEESRDNQMCTVVDAVTKEKMICLDSKRLFSVGGKLQLDIHTLIGGVWHELAHLYGPEISHDMIYYFGNKMKNLSIAGALFTTNAFDKEENSLCAIGDKKYKGLNRVECMRKAASSKAKKASVFFRKDVFDKDSEHRIGVIRNYDRPAGKIICSVYTYDNSMDEKFFYDVATWKRTYLKEVTDVGGGTSYSGEYSGMRVVVSNAQDCFDYYALGFKYVRILQEREGFWQKAFSNTGYRTLLDF